MRWFTIKNYLGNARVSFGRTSAGALEIVDSNDYYPFGMNHLKTGNAFFVQGSYKNYKYNGKELQETGMYDYGARMYMADIGRWGVVDPLAEKMTRYSPYNYAFNNPIFFIDPDGRKPDDHYIDKATGKYLGSDGASTNNIRSIDRRDFADINITNNGTTSAEATAQLQANSNGVNIDDAQIQGELQTVSDLSRKTEHQTFIVYDRQNSSVSAIRGDEGTDGTTTIPSTISQTGNNGVTVDNLIKLGGKSYILIGEAHGHNLSQDSNKINLAGTSPDKDKPAAIATGINIYAIDAYNTKVGGQADIHSVNATGVQSKFVGKTAGASGIGTKTVNVGLESLKSWAGIK